MTQIVNVPLSDGVYKQLKRWADDRQQNIEVAIANYLSENLPVDDDILIVPPHEPDPRVEREKEAYLRLYPKLKEKYSGMYVAIYDGELIDYDADFGSLFERIDDKFPTDVFVWMTQVTDEPIRTLHFRSPRFTEPSR